MTGARLMLALVVAVALIGCKSDAQQAADFLAVGLAAHQAGNLDEAETNYQACLDHEPTNKYCLFNLGVIAQSRGNLDDAADSYQLAIDQDPNFASPVYNLATINAAQGETDEAINLYRRVIAIEPNNASAHFNLGLLLIKKGDTAGGQAELATAKSLNPDLIIPTSPPVSPSPVPSPT